MTPPPPSTSHYEMPKSSSRQLRGPRQMPGSRSPVRAASPEKFLPQTPEPRNSPHPVASHISPVRNENSTHSHYQIHDSQALGQSITHSAQRLERITLEHPQNASHLSVNGTMPSHGAHSSLHSSTPDRPSSSQSNTSPNRSLDLAGKRGPIRRRPVSAVDTQTHVYESRNDSSSQPYLEHDRNSQYHSEPQSRRPDTMHLSPEISPQFAHSPQQKDSSVDPRTQALESLNGQNSAPQKRSFSPLSDFYKESDSYPSPDLNKDYNKSYRNTVQGPVQGHTPNRQDNGHWRPSSTGSPTPTSTEYPQSSTTSEPPNERNEFNTNQSSASYTPIITSIPGRGATPSTPSTAGAGADLNGPWKYHIQKNLKDFYMTTNPDSDHIKCPIGPSYYVEVNSGGQNSLGQTTFSLSLMTPMDQLCEITIQRGFRQNEEEYFEVTTFTKGGSNSPEKSGAVTSQISWKGQAVAIRASAQEDYGSSRILGKRPPTRQFLFQDEKGHKWIVGNRNDQPSTVFNLDPGLEVSDEEILDHGYTGDTSTKKRSTKVYFFAPGPSGPGSDKIMAVLQRRKQLRKKLMKEVSRFSHVDDGSSDYKKRSIFKQNSSNSPPPMVSSVFGTVEDNGDGYIEEEDVAKFGWLTLYENVKRRQGMWPIVTALTLAVSYSQKMDSKEKSVTEKLKKFGRKYRESRIQVFQGTGGASYRHTQSWEH